MTKLQYGQVKLHVIFIVCVEIAASSTHVSISDTVKHFLEQVFKMHQSIFVLISGKVLSLLMTVGLSDLEHVRT